jgi:hypothetical protein
VPHMLCIEDKKTWIYFSQSMRDFVRVFWGIDLVTETDTLGYRTIWMKYLGTEPHAQMIPHLLSLDFDRSSESFSHRCFNLLFNKGDI